MISARPQPPAARTPSRARAWIWILLSLCAGCAHHRSPSPTPLLHTRITEGDLKLFELAFPMPARPLSLPGGEGGPREKRPDLSSKRMQQMLDEVMEESRYCRDGYVLLGRYAGETTRRLRGECKDRATEEDRRKFPDTVERW